MASFAPGPWSQTDDQFCVKDGTLCKVPSPAKNQAEEWADGVRAKARARAEAQIEQFGSPREKFLMRVHGILPDQPQPELRAFYSKHDREMDESPLPWVF